MVWYFVIEYLLLASVVKSYVYASYAEEVNTDQPQVYIPQGRLQGTIRTTHRNRSVSAFLGIPYAQPPIGNLRFANPVAAGGWTGTLNASVDSNQCPQISGDEIVGDEDCLYLNVYTPQLPENATSRLLTVMVYICGGAFNQGNDDSTIYGPEYLLDKDVVLVVFNYRVGALGFLSTGDVVAPGNWELKDQVLVLKWVQSNIQYFGGDPNQVTLFGASSGSAAVHFLSMSNLTIGLFQRCITEAGSALSPWAYRPSAVYASQAFRLGKYVGCSNATTVSLIECLRAVNVSEIIKANSNFLVWESFPTVVWGPTDEPDIEGAVLTDSPQNLIRNGQVHDIPRMTGVCRDDGLAQTAAFYQNDTLFDEFLENLDHVLPLLFNRFYLPDTRVAWIEPIKSHYFSDLKANRSLLLSNFTLLVSDVDYWYPIYDAIRQQSTVTVNPQYLYVFSYRGILSNSYLYSGTTINYGVAHCDELLYLFPNTAIFSSLNETRSAKDYEMMDIMVELWTSFAIEGKPTTSALGNNKTWEPFSITEDNNIHIGNNSDLKLSFQYSYFKERFQFWDNVTANVTL